MVINIIFSDPLRQEEIELFYKSCQMHRDFYKGYASSPHPLEYFLDPEYSYQCPPEMSYVYLSYPARHVKYKQPVVLPMNTGITSGFPPLPGRSLAGRYNKNACNLFIR